MKQIILLTASLLLALSAFSQDIEGSWSGTLNTGLIKLRIVLNISEKDGGYSATMDSPDQGAKGIPVTAVSFENAKLIFSISNLKVEYEGVWQNDSIAGTFKQGGMVFPLNLKRGTVLVSRPQEPKPPFPYHSEDVKFENPQAGIALAGTLTLPQKGKNFPVAVLVTGSGPQNRNEELLGHKPFLVLSDYLTRNGIAVLRYDDRGVAESGGKYETATLADFATDAAAAVNYLKTRKEINPKKIGIIGHSEGGTIAFMLASDKKNNLAYVVSMAGMAIRGDSLLKMQRYLISKAMGISDEDIAKNEKALDDITAKQTISPEIQSIINYDPAEALAKIKCPVLALNGEKDLQVAPDINLSRVKALVKGKTTVKKYPTLNHLFQHCTTGLPNEYNAIEETLSPEVLSDIAAWINGL